jgi:hypothetical protein
MSQRTRILTQIGGFRGWKVAEHRRESRDGAAIEPVGGYDVPADARLVLVLERRWAPRCARCLASCGECREKLRTRRWTDLPACGHPVVLEVAPWRLSCPRCGARAVELLAWADPYQRQSRRLQHHLALDAFSMPLSHVSTKWGLSWSTVRRAKLDAIDRWDKAQPPVLLGVAATPITPTSSRNSASSPPTQSAALPESSASSRSGCPLPPVAPPDAHPPQRPAPGAGLRS